MSEANGVYPQSKRVLLRELSDNWEWSVSVNVDKNGASTESVKAFSDTIAAGALLQIRDAVKSLKNRKSVSLVVVEKLLAEIRGVLLSHLPPSPADRARWAREVRESREKGSRDRAWAAYLKAGGNPHLGEEQVPTGGIGLGTLLWGSELSLRTQRAMNRLGIGTVGELIQRTWEDLLATKNFGVVSLAEVRDWLLKHGLYLKGESPANKAREKELRDARSREAFALIFGKAVRATG